MWIAETEIPETEYFSGKIEKIKEHCEYIESRYLLRSISEKEYHAEMAMLMARLDELEAELNGKDGCEDTERS